MPLYHLHASASAGSPRVAPEAADLPDLAALRRALRRFAGATIAGAPPAPGLGSTWFFEARDGEGRALMFLTCCATLSPGGLSVLSAGEGAGA